MALYCYRFGVVHYIIYLLSWAFMFTTHIISLVYYPRDTRYSMMEIAFISLTVVTGVIYIITGCFYVCKLGRENSDSSMIVAYTFVFILATVSMISNVIYLSIAGLDKPNAILIIGLYCGCFVICGGFYIWVWCIRCHPPK